MTKISVSIFLICTVMFSRAEDGHELWLRKKTAVPVNVICSKKSATLSIAINELQQGWQAQQYH